MAIYTRTGDKGKTSLFSGLRVSKSDLRIDAYGIIDELNSVIGVAIAEIENSKGKNQNHKSKLKSELKKIQNDLLKIGSSLTSNRISNLSKRVKEFEDFIDKMTAQMPKLSNFILPGGGKTGAMLHLSRAICRRLERKIVVLNNRQKIDSNIIVYFNRLSDLLFTMARFANFKEKKREIIWRKNG